MILKMQSGMHSSCELLYTIVLVREILGLGYLCTVHCSLIFYSLQNLQTVHTTDV